MIDSNLSAIQAYWDTIANAYLEHRAQQPLIELELPRLVVFAQPAHAYIASLAERERPATLQLYNEACTSGSILVFVRDTELRTLRSYVFPFHHELSAKPTRVATRRTKRRRASTP